ncbi:MAG: ribosome-associated translation inhibitor RaiA [Clostridia bacterium]|nr:ribosome-associated translation inhibitor RaiA [Clostridia bacterium]
MKFIISGRNIELTEALKNYAEEKFSKLEKVIKKDCETTVNMSTERNLQIVEVNMKAGTKIYRAQEEKPDMYEAIDELVDVLQRQIRKTKEKEEKNFKKDTIRGKEYLSSDVVRDAVKDQVVKYIAYPMKPMSIEDAMIILKDNDDVFFTFINIDTREVNVLYKTNDGNFGIVEPEM